jgi:quercetin dioxygenase-like cupin family protein
MRTVLVLILISIAVAATSQDHIAGSNISSSPAADFTSLEKFLKGEALSNREVTVYRIRASNLPTHKYPKPVVIVWTKEGVVTEQKEGEASTTRKVSVGQIDVYPSGTIHSLRAVEGSLHFTLVELKQNLRDPKELPNKPGSCENFVEFPEGGFACLIRIAPGQQVTIPELDVNFFFIAINPGTARYTVPRHNWEAHYLEGKPECLPGYEQHAIQNLERRPLQFALIVPPPAEYK